ncbi:FaeA/PapI family transcriptional regulator [Escherichia coli]|uniref:FaeA/PapI family transcriptional regulator n=1 Tax=Escherichia coli TaxID=562 RepID=UPI002227295B|nr:FaeA/PapI family transcriptional regulator [Escherichia coli]MCW3227930.1 FaeA/PapI family transcriptional regulator [Escherichia coli]MCW7174577.1 FaeA/PapI family transcriptional regulator [Escherichia coli]
MKDNILTFLTELKTPYRTTEIAIHFGLSAYQARYYLMTLEKEGKIKRSPVRRGASTLWEMNS